MTTSAWTASSPPAPVVPAQVTGWWALIVAAINLSAPTAPLLEVVANDIEPGLLDLVTAPSLAAAAVETVKSELLLSITPDIAMTGVDVQPGVFGLVSVPELGMAGADVQAAALDLSVAPALDMSTSLVIIYVTWLDDNSDPHVSMLASDGTQSEITSQFTGLGTGGVALIATDSTGNLYLPDPDNQRILVLSVGGTLTVLSTAGLYPDGIFVSGDTIYFVDTVTATVQKMPTSGGSPANVGFTGLDQPMQPTVDSAGNVYVCSSANKNVQQMSSSGVQSTLPFTGLVAPFGVVVASDGIVYVSQGTTAATASVEQLSETSDPEIPVTVPFTLGTIAQSSVGFTGLGSGPASVALDAAGNLYVADASNGRVLKMSNNIQSVLGFTDIVSPQGIAISSTSVQ